jgi:cation diffusion facilitator family transporter
MMEEEAMVAVDFENETVSQLSMDPDDAPKPGKKASHTRSLAEHMELTAVREDQWMLKAEEQFLPLKKEEEAGVGRGRRNKVQKFYRRQNAQIDEFVSLEREMGGRVDKAEQREAEELEARRQRGVKIAIYGSFILNVVLFVAKIVAVVLSGSISLIASAVDSGLDLMSGSIIFITSCLMKRKRSIYLYPAGNTRIEPIGVIIFASAMFVATFQIIVEAIQKFVSLAATPSTGVHMDYLTIGIVCGTIVIKFFMWLYCIAYRKKSSSVRALATDHITDVVANIFLLGCYLIGVLVWPYMDPLGGILISFYLMYNWYQEGSMEVKKLSGQSAPPEFLSKITFLVWNHSPMIVSVDTVRAFHLANGFTVEVDIVLPFDMLLRDAHDVGEALQHRLESVEEVERAYVHLDFEVEHVPATEHPAQNYASSHDESADEENDALIPLEKQFEQNASSISPTKQM